MPSESCLVVKYGMVEVLGLLEHVLAEHAVVQAGRGDRAHVVEAAGVDRRARTRRACARAVDVGAPAAPRRWPRGRRSRRGGRSASTLPLSFAHVRGGDAELRLGEVADDGDDALVVGAPASRAARRASSASPCAPARRSGSPRFSRLRDEEPADEAGGAGDEIGHRILLALDRGRPTSASMSDRHRVAVARGRGDCTARAALRQRLRTRGSFSMIALCGARLEWSDGGAMRRDVGARRRTTMLKKASEAASWPATKTGSRRRTCRSRVLDSSRQIWLAGLGAFSRAQAEGMKVFEIARQAGRGARDEDAPAAADTAAAARGAAKAKVKEMQQMAWRNVGQAGAGVRGPRRARAVEARRPHAERRRAARRARRRAVRSGERADQGVGGTRSARDGAQARRSDARSRRPGGRAKRARKRAAPARRERQEAARTAGYARRAPRSTRG